MVKESVDFDIRRDVVEAVMNDGIVIVTEYGRATETDFFSSYLLVETLVKEAKKSGGYTWFAQVLNTGRAESDVVRFLLVKADMNDETECFDSQLKPLLEFHELGFFGGKKVNAKAGIFASYNTLKTSFGLEPWEYLNTLEAKGLI